MLARDTKEIIYTISLALQRKKINFIKLMQDNTKGRIIQFNKLLQALEDNSILLILTII